MLKVGEGNFFEIFIKFQGLFLGYILQLYRFVCDICDACTENPGIYWITYEFLI